MLAAPAVSAREILEARRAVAVRVPAEGVVAVLQKRPYPAQTVTSTNDASGPSPEYPEPQSAKTPGPLQPEEYHDASPELEPPQPEEAYHDASSSELKPPPEEEHHAHWGRINGRRCGKRP